MAFQFNASIFEASILNSEIKNYNSRLGREVYLNQNQTFTFALSYQCGCSRPTLAEQCTKPLAPTQTEVHGQKNKSRKLATDEIYQGGRQKRLDHFKVGFLSLPNVQLKQKCFHL